MGANKGRKKPDGATRPFVKGFDPRRNSAGRPKVDVLVQEMKSDIKEMLAVALRTYFFTEVAEVMKMANDTNKKMGERIALRFLVETANKGDPARVSLLAKIIGLELPEKVAENVNINIVESAFSTMTEEDKTKILQAAMSVKMKRLEADVVGEQ